MDDRIDIPWLEANGFERQQQSQGETWWVRDLGRTRTVAVPTGHHTFVIGLDTSDRQVVRDVVAVGGETIAPPA